MSKYTTELRYILESLIGSSFTPNTTPLDVIDLSWNKVFDFNFPIFDENHRKTLCTNILLNFYTREIGMETYALWKTKLISKMLLIMPKYNLLYEAWSKDFNPLDNVNINKNSTVDYTSKITENNNVDTTTSSNGESQSKNLFSDTPQGGLTGLDNETYLTQASKAINNYNDETSKQEQSDKDSNKIDNTKNIETIVGKNNSESYGKILNDYKEYVINIDNLIIDELEPLFMQMW